MGRRPPDRRLRRTPALLLAAALFAGCAITPAPGVGVTLADTLGSALSDHSIDAFLTAFSDDDQGRARGTSWYTALSAADGDLRQDGASQVEVTTTFPGDRRAATQTIAYQLEDDGSLITGVSPTPGTPLWALEATSITTGVSGTLVSAGLDDTARSAWSNRLDHAAATVDREGVPGVGGWTGGLVVEVPRGDADFQVVTGSAASSASAITTCEGGTPRIVISPRALSLGTGWLDSTLVHEAVHVATDSACVAPGDSLDWAVEGLAESVAARTDAATASRNRELVADELAAHGVPDALPARLETLTDYALAQLAVDQVRAHLGPRADDLLDRAIHDAPGVTAQELRKVTGWYVAELRRRAHMSR